jgi:hypothetical protein
MKSEAKGKTAPCKECVIRPPIGYHGQASGRNGVFVACPVMTAGLSKIDLPEPE